MSSNKKKVLFIDDNPMSIEIYKASLKGSSTFECIFCNTPEKAMKVICEQKISGIITDLVMPNINGIDLLNAINEHQNQCFKILITGSTSLDTIVHIVNKVGIDHILIKPIQVELSELKNIINKYIELQSPEVAIAS